MYGKMPNDTTTAVQDLSNVHTSHRIPSSQSPPRYIGCHMLPPALDTLWCSTIHRLQQQYGLLRCWLNVVLVIGDARSPGVWEEGDYRASGLGGKARDPCLLSLPLTTAAHAPQHLGAAQSRPLSCLGAHRHHPDPPQPLGVALSSIWSCPAAHRHLPGPGYIYPAPG